MRIMKHILILLLLVCTSAVAQDVKNVHGTAALTIADNMTIPQAEQECLRQARNNAIKEAFGETVTSSTNMMDATVNGKTVSNFIEETSLVAKGNWIRDTKKPQVTRSISDGGKVVINAEVWGKAREIVRAPIQLTWKILRSPMQQDGRVESTDFANHDRIYINFRSPVDGYVAVYLLNTANDNVDCLLPYKTDVKGQHRVKGGVEYTFFDKTKDAHAVGYNLTTNMPYEVDQVFVIFSPNAFTKCIDTNSGMTKPTTLTKNDFQKWLSSQTDFDKDMVVDGHTFVTITNPK